MSLGSRLLSRSRPEKICEHRTVAGAADLDRLGRGFPFDRDGVARERKGGWPRWRGVTSGLARFQALDDQVKDIRAGRRHAPGDASIVTEHDARNPGSAGADAAEARRLEPDEVPDARCAELQMRIVGEERLAAARARAREHPAIRRVWRRRLRRQGVDGGCEPCGRPVADLPGDRCRGVGRPVRPEQAQQIRLVSERR